MNDLTDTERDYDDDLTEAEAGIVVLTDEDVPRTEADVKRAVAAALAPIQALRDQWKRDDANHLVDHGQHLPAHLAVLAEQLDAALAAVGVDAEQGEPS